MTLRTTLCDKLGIEHPIVQAPMAGFSTPELVAAVSNAGGLGSLGSAMLAPDELRRQGLRVRQMTGRPWALNFFVHKPPTPDPQRIEALRARLKPYYAELGLGEVPEPPAPPPPFNADTLAVALELAPPIVSFHFGLPAPELLEPVRDAGITILASATTVSEAQALDGAGVDAIVAQGFEAGGHQGALDPDVFADPIGTLALVPQVVDAVAVPVIAAGGIMDGRGVAAVLCLGAQAAQLGTAFMGCPECQVSDLHRQALLAKDGRATVLTRAFSGRPARSLVNRLAREMADAGVTDFPVPRGVVSPLTKAAVAQGSAEFSPLWAGQGYGLMRKLPAAELIDVLRRECVAALQLRPDPEPIQHPIPSVQP
jgi:nitronate monooxygenase